MDEKLTSALNEEQKTLLTPYDAEKGEVQPSSPPQPTTASGRWRWRAALIVFLITMTPHVLFMPYMSGWISGSNEVGDAAPWAMNAFEGKRMTPEDAEKLFL